MGPGQHIEKARRNLASGKHLLSGDFTEQAGRDAYLAAFHAAQASTVSRTGKGPKTHTGTRSEFVRLAREDAQIDPAFVAFLGRAYELKTYTGYDGSQPLSRQDAAAALAMAAQFVEAIAGLLSREAE